MSGFATGSDWEFNTGKLESRWVVLTICHSKKSSLGSSRFGGVSDSTIKLTMRGWVMQLCKNGGMSKSVGHVCLLNQKGGGGLGWLFD